MSTIQKTGNKATFERFCDAMNTGDAEVISSTIDELVERDALIRTPLPLDSTGRDKLKEVFGRLHQAFPDLRVTIEDLIVRFVAGRVAETWGVVDVFAQMRQLGLVPAADGVRKAA
jgi:predicted ester cyclase